MLQEAISRKDGVFAEVDAISARHTHKKAWMSDHPRFSFALYNHVAALQENGIPVDAITHFAVGQCVFPAEALYCIGDLHD